MITERAVMGLFNQRRPRAFHYEYMFVDRRKERLEAIKEKTGREESASVEPAPKGRLARGVFLNATKYAFRRNERGISGGRFVTTVVAMLLILLLVLIWRILLYV